MKAQKAVFLDRDGTLMQDKNYLFEPNKIELFDDTAHFLKTLKNNNFLIFLFTNQSGIGRGYFKLEDAIACNNHMLSLCGFDSSLFQEICIAPDDPSHPNFNPETSFRKPNPNFILNMMSKYNLDQNACFMVGDKIEDLLAGIQASITSIWVATGKPWTHELQKLREVHSFPVCKNLTEVLKIVCTV